MTQLQHFELCKKPHFIVQIIQLMFEKFDLHLLGNGMQNSFDMHCQILHT